MRDGTNASQIKAFVASLRENDWTQHGIDERWIGYLFHITSVENAVSIISQNRISSRVEATTSGLLRHDGAAKSIIGQTDSFVKQCARFYFRPRVPTFYHNEGFISSKKVQASPYHAHIPLPIAFILHLHSVLALPSCQFSDGNASSKNSKRMDTFAEFKNLPFEKIYSTGAMTTDEKDELRLRRHSEVLVPKHLELHPHLYCIACRSDAELKTLKHLLTQVPGGRRLRDQLDSRMIVSTNGSIFEARRPFVQSIRQTGATILIELNHTTRPADGDPNLFRVRVQARSGSGKVFLTTDEEIPLEGTPSMRISNIGNPDTETYTLEVRFDDTVAYAAEHRWIPSEGTVL